jgi:hypothetical protein
MKTESGQSMGHEMQHGEYKKRLDGMANKKRLTTKLPVGFVAREVGGYENHQGFTSPRPAGCLENW